MINLVIKGWSDERTWLCSESWSHLDYCQRLYPCTYLRGKALERAAHRLANRERCEFELIGRERAEALIYTLDTCGAQFEFKYLRLHRVIFLDHYRKAANVNKTLTKVITDAR
jgi:hypothetical protein